MPEAALERPPSARRCRRSCRATCSRSAGSTTRYCPRTTTARSTGPVSRTHFSSPNRRTRRAKRTEGRTRMTDTIDRLKTLFIEHLHIDAPPAELDLFESGTLDSLQLV